MRNCVITGPHRVSRSTKSYSNPISTLWQAYLLVKLEFATCIGNAIIGHVKHNHPTTIDIMQAIII